MHLRNLYKTLIVLKGIYPPRLVALVTAPVLTGYMVNAELMHPFSLPVPLLWLLLFTLPYFIFEKKAIYFFATAFYYVAGFIEIIHWILMQGPLTISSLLVISQSNYDEALAFINLKSNFGLLLLFPYTMLFLYAIQKAPAIYKIRYRIPFVSLLSFMVVLFFFWASKTVAKVRLVPQIAKVSFAFVNELQDYQAAIEVSALREVEARVPEEHKRQTFVLILGESCSRNHMSLYGAPTGTNPKLQGRKDLFVYKNAVSPYSYTLLSIPSVISASNLENELSFSESVDLLDIFHSAGFKTYWISNQSPIGLWDNLISSIAGKSDVVKFVNTTGNSSQETILNRSYDARLFRPFTRALADNAPRKFIVLHLMGSHSTYSKRYPKAFDHFRGAGYKQSLIAEYHNTLLYNDFVVDSLLNSLSHSAHRDKAIASAIYVSDHGENVYDEMDKVGHDYAQHIPKANVEIPYIVWLSPQYRKTYPNKAFLVKANMNAAFVTDDLFHSVMDINGVSSPYFVPERSVFNDKFNHGRPRILDDGLDYDQK